LCQPSPTSTSRSSPKSGPASCPSFRGDLRLQLDACCRQGNEESDIAVKAFELSLDLRAKWITAEFSAKRRIPEIACLNLRLDEVTFVPTMRKPFDMLAERLISAESRGDRRWTFLNDLTGMGLFQLAIAQVEGFSADTFFALGSAEA
jgi:hypothetical protein